VAGHRQVDEIEAEIIAVDRRIYSIKDEIARWNDVSADLSVSAAVERARNGEMGRGLGGALFGAKYRAAARRAAASSNAAIAREVATRRSDISRAKQSLRIQERELGALLRDLKAQLKASRSLARRQESRNRSAPPAPAPVAQPVDVKKELQRLKALYQQGQLDAMAYENARIELLRPLLRS
jgi:chromosome segregation ATPase